MSTLFRRGRCPDIPSVFCKHVEFGTVGFAPHFALLVLSSDPYARHRRNPAAIDSSE